MIRHTQNASSWPSGSGSIRKSIARPRSPLARNAPTYSGGILGIVKYSVRSPGGIDSHNTR
jgi:hypothetical protein